MRSILVVNAKGGCGKTTIATALATLFATRGKSVTLVDLDPQGSSTDWLAVRPEERPAIHGIEGWHTRIRYPRGTDVAVLDAPAGVHGAELAALVKRAQTVIVPVLPSPLDLRAAQRFTEDLLALRAIVQKRARVGTVINRARENSPGRLRLEEYLRHLRLPDGRRLPFIGVLRSSQNYLKAAERGLGIFEIAPSAARHDLGLWRPIMRWLDSKRSRPSPGPS